MTEPHRYGYSGAVDPVRSSWDDGIPVEVFSLSRMSRSERRNLVHKLNMDLEQVQALRKKISCVSSDTAPLLPYSNIHGCSDGPRRPSQVNCAAVVGSAGKQLRPTRKDKQRSKKVPRRSKSTRLVAPKSFTFASVMKECEKLLDHLLSHTFGWAFRFPVDPVRMNIPDYCTVIKHPMDFGTIRSKLRNNNYYHPEGFGEDVRLTFSNSMAYNPPGNDYHTMAQALSKIFERKWKVIEKKIPFMTPLTPTCSLNSETPFETAAADESKLRVKPAKLVMTAGEKEKLGEDLLALELEGIPENILNFLKQHSCLDDQTSEAEIVIDIDNLSDELLFMLRKLMDDYLMAKKKNQEKSEPCKIEIGLISGFSNTNSPLQLSKDDLQSDEDVDIVGGCDTPLPSHFPVKIEKDAACNNNESSSSSSDSDSSSSSGTETDNNKASDPSTEDKKESGVDSNSKGEKIVVSDSLNELGQVGHGVGDKSIAMDGVDDVLQDEETTPPKTLVSSDRAALLKNRFADTIFKAREKTFTKGEEGDPEKLRIKREQFEKWQRKENIRLQADAEAAEKARRKAEAEEARRIREEEREAARQALEKMEKTVEIDENNQVMTDLEMLTVAEFDQLPIFMEETNPNRIRDVLGSFKIKSSSNASEKLGLYMKMDDDQDVDEEVQPLSPHGEEEQTLNQVSEDPIKRKKKKKKKKKKRHLTK